MQEITNQEARTLEAAGDLLQQVRRGVRVLDVISNAVAAYTHDGQTRAAWDAFERQVNRLGAGQDPELYCAECKGEGERALPPDATGRVRLDVCPACEGQAFLGTPRPSLPPLYAPGDEALMPLF
jgi:hypothetical protein